MENKGNFPSFFQRRLWRGEGGASTRPENSEMEVLPLLLPPPDEKGLERRGKKRKEKVLEGSRKGGRVGRRKGMIFSHSPPPPRLLKPKSARLEPPSTSLQTLSSSLPPFLSESNFHHPPSVKNWLERRRTKGRKSGEGSKEGQASVKISFAHLVLLPPPPPPPPPLEEEEEAPTAAKQ